MKAIAFFIGTELLYIKVFYDSFSVWLVTLPLILRKIIERAIARDILRKTKEEIGIDP